MTIDRDKLRADLLRDEGESLTPYRDSTGHITIGVGHLLRSGDGWIGRSHITREESRAQLERDIDRAEHALCTALPWVEGLDEVRARAFVELTFNLGIGGLLAFHKMLAHAQAGEWPGAAQELLSSRWYQQVRGARAGRLAAMLGTGEAEA